MNKYDVIIIGGGLSGCTLGYLLKQQNKKVLIVEKQPRASKNKLCGGLLTEKAYHLLCDIFGKSDIEKLAMINYEQAMINNKKDTIEIKGINAFCIDRKILDDFVLNKYISKEGDFFDNSPYQSINTEINQLIINDKIYHYKYLVGADGIFSKVRKDITKKQQKTNFALEVIDSNIKSNLEISFYDTFKGYGWIIPNRNNTMIGIGEVSGKTKLENILNDHLEKLDLNSNKKKGAFLPTGKDIFLNHKNIFFIGDSAGLISPITGEGIYYALKSAEILSISISECNYKKRMKPMIKNIKKDLFYMKFVYNR